MKGPLVYRCSGCGGTLERKHIAYGAAKPDAEADDVISGDCCADKDSPNVGYQCPKCLHAYVVTQGRLLPLGKEEEADEGQDEEERDDSEDPSQEIDDDIQDLEMLDFFDDDFL